MCAHNTKPNLISHKCTLHTSHDANGVESERVSECRALNGRNEAKQRRIHFDALHPQIHSNAWHINLRFKFQRSPCAAVTPLDAKLQHNFTSNWCWNIFRFNAFRHIITSYENLLRICSRLRVHVAIRSLTIQIVKRKALTAEFVLDNLPHGTHLRLIYFVSSGWLCLCRRLCLCLRLVVALEWQHIQVVRVLLFKTYYCGRRVFYFQLSQFLWQIEGHQFECHLTWNFHSNIQEGFTMIEDEPRRISSRKISLSESKHFEQFSCTKTTDDSSMFGLRRLTEWTQTRAAQAGSPRPTPNHFSRVNSSRRRTHCRICVSYLRNITCETSVQINSLPKMYFRRVLRLSTMPRNGFSWILSSIDMTSITEFAHESQVARIWCISIEREKN